MATPKRIDQFFAELEEKENGIGNGQGNEEDQGRVQGRGIEEQAQGDERKPVTGRGVQDNGNNGVQAQEESLNNKLNRIPKYRTWISDGVPFCLR